VILGSLLQIYPVNTEESGRNRIGNHGLKVRFTSNKQCLNRRFPFIFQVPIIIIKK